MKILLAVTLFFASSYSVFAADTTVQNDRNTVDRACSNEQAVAGCGNDVVGPVLFDCIKAYKKAHQKTFKISSSCKSAMKKLHTDEKASN